MVYAHRFAFAAATGADITEQVLHSCDNPLCVNPAHLFQGTQTDNMKDAQAKKRLWERRGIDGRFIPKEKNDAAS
jgi:HNH endonuclease